jgi:hypothetical protein
MLVAIDPPLEGDLPDRIHEPSGVTLIRTQLLLFPRLSGFDLWCPRGSGRIQVYAQQLIPDDLAEAPESLDLQQYAFGIAWGEVRVRRGLRSAGD